MMSTPAPSFDDPLGLLRACHQRMRARVETLERLREHVARQGADQAAREAAQQVLNYFERAAPHHHADEEQDLFPLLRADTENTAGARALRALLAQLAAQHDDLEQGWARLRSALQALLEGAASPLSECGAELAAWSQALRDHMDVEEAQVLPLAARVLSVEALAALGAAMQARRRV